MKEASEEMIRKKSAMKVQNHKSTKEAACNVFAKTDDGTPEHSNRTF